jgi:hypothetical protein
MLVHRYTRRKLVVYRKSPYKSMLLHLVHVVHQNSKEGSVGSSVSIGICCGAAKNATRESYITGVPGVLVYHTHIKVCPINGLAPPSLVHHHHRRGVPGVPAQGLNRGCFFKANHEP